MKLDINLIWAVVVLLVAGMATVYSLNKQKLEKLKLIHPKLATVLDFNPRTCVRCDFKRSRFC